MSENLATLLPLSENFFRELLRARPERQIIPWVVYVEDIYETIFGDGYYTYGQRAFFEKEPAIRCAEWMTKASTAKPSMTGYRAEAKPVTVILDLDDQFRIPKPQGYQSLNWEEITLLEMINGTYSDWKSKIRYCLGPSGIEPDFMALDTSEKSL